MIDLGDTVRYYFSTAAGTTLVWRPATVTKIYGRPLVGCLDLQVQFTEEDLRHGFTLVQTQVKQGATGKVTSGQWMPAPITRAR